MANGEEYSDTRSNYDEEREKILDNLSTLDKIRYKNLETRYEIDRQTGEKDVPENKHQYILSQIFKNRR